MIVTCLRVSTDTLLLVNDGRVGEFDGSLDDYPKWLADQNKTGRSTERSTKKRSQQDRKAQKRLEAELRQSLAPLRKVVKETEEAMERLTEQKKSVEEQLADSSLYESGSEDLLKSIAGKAG